MTQEVIELIEVNSPITITLGLNRMRILHGSLKALDYPKFIRLLINQEKKLLGVQACAEDHKDVFKISKWVLNSKNGLEISGRQFIYLIFELMNWDMNLSYKVVGIKDDKSHSIFFNLDEAIKIAGYNNQQKSKDVELCRTIYPCQRLY
ncbi:MAG: hypothetical protein FWE36_00100 [Erysipelotrichales bacterium]|nr:hypothetical protein [Erysipelotrichales bacterium]